MTIGQRVKQLRKNKGMTQEELAEKLGYKSKSSVTHIENGRDIPRSMIVELAKILDTTPAYLMGWEPAPIDKVTLLLSENPENLEKIKLAIAEKFNVPISEFNDMTYDNITEVLKTIQEKYDINISKIESTNKTPLTFYFKESNGQLQIMADYDNSNINSNDNIYQKYYNIRPVQLKRFPMLGDIACGEPIFADEDREHYIMADMDIKADFCLTAKGDSMINARIYDGDVVFIKQTDVVENGEIAAVIIEDEATLKRVYYDRENNILQLVAENPKYKPLVYRDEQLDEVHILGKAVYFMSAL